MRGEELIGELTFESWRRFRSAESQEARSRKRAKAQMGLVLVVGASPVGDTGVALLG